MDNVAVVERLIAGAEAMRVPLTRVAADALVRYANELLRWNQKVNLTAIRSLDEAVEKHLLDSLAVVPEVASAKTVLDLGTGGGLPGIPLAIVLPELRVTLVDAVAKKVGFLKSAVATLGLAPRVRAVHLHVRGEPDAEGIERAEVVISRAFMDVPEWARLGRPYVAPGGRLVAMTGKDPGSLDDVAREMGYAFVTTRRYELPESHAERHVSVFPVAR